MFRRKPDEVHAVQWLGENTNHSAVGVEVVDDLRTAGGKAHRYFVLTPQGKMPIKRGDWIVTDATGGAHPMSPEIFKAFYEPLPEDVLAKALA